MGKVKTKYLLQRSVSIYRKNGLVDLLRAGRRFVIHGSLRNELLNLLPATKCVLRWRIQCSRVIYPSRFTDANPFKILWVDPDEITRAVSSSSIPMRFGEVYGGDWDRTGSCFKQRPVYRAMESHFRNGVPWEETKYYNLKRNKLNTGKSTRGCVTVDDLPGYFARFDDIYNTLKTEGYKTQQELMRESPNETIIQNLDAPIPELNEIGVCIGRDGELLRRYRGEHRLAIAKVADVDAVAIQVLVRHTKWQRLRNTLRKNPSANTTRTNHPDLDDLST